jgi:CBS domain-containing protein
MVADMVNRVLGTIVKDQRPLVLGLNETIQKACSEMWQRHVGSILVVDAQNRLCGIFTGRDAVRALSNARSAEATRLKDAMTPSPVTITPDHRAIDALRAMCDGGFRHVPVIENDKIWGVVSRGDFTGMELDRLEEEEHLWECIR